MRTAMWVCDLTYLKTLEGFVFLAFVKDVFSRFITGFQLADNLRTDLVLDALEMAAHLRRPAATAVLVAHSDRGSGNTRACATPSALRTSRSPRRSGRSATRSTLSPNPPTERLGAAK